MTDDDNITPPPYAMDTFKTSITADKVVSARRNQADYLTEITTLGLPDGIYVELPRETPQRDAQGNSTDYLPVANCRDCHEPLTGDNESHVTRERTCTITGSEHIPIPIPLSWANNAEIRLDAERDLVRVGISVSDPRGGFCLEIRRELVGDSCPNPNCHIETFERPKGSDNWTNEYQVDGKTCPTCDGTGSVNRHYELRMSLPHHTDGQLHAPLTDLNGRGYYKIGY